MNTGRHLRKQLSGLLADNLEAKHGYKLLLDESIELIDKIVELKSMMEEKDKEIDYLSKQLAREKDINKELINEINNSK